MRVETIMSGGKSQFAWHVVLFQISFSFPIQFQFSLLFQVGLALSDQNKLTILAQNESRNKNVRR